MAQNGARRGSTNLTVPLMLGAFVLLAGFLYWLSVTAEPTAPPEIVEEDEPAEEAAMESTVVDPTALETNPGGYTGVRIRLDSVTVAQTIGSKSFFVDLPRTPFLVHMSPELEAAGTVLPPAGEAIRLVGDVMAMTDSTVAAWSEAGEFNDSDRVLIEFATHYIQAVQLGTGSGSAEADTTAAGEGG